MSKNTYIDKHGREIREGMMISIDGGAPEKVYRCAGDCGFGEEHLGVNASNEEYLKRHPEATREYYPLSNYYSSDIEIVAG